MKVGDLVRHKMDEQHRLTTRLGVIVDIIQKKVWRAGCMGKTVDWSKVEPEAHAVVLYDDCQLNIPIIDLEVIRAI